MDKNQRRKIAFIFSIFILGFSVVIFRLAYINVVKGEEFRDLIEADKYYEKVLKYERGEILDRTGVKLAFSVIEYKITIHDYKEMPVETFDKVVFHLADILDMTYDEIVEKGGQKHLVVTKSASESQRKRIDVAFNPYLWIDEFISRNYPNEQLAADVIGRVAYDEEKEILNGEYGVERSYNESLKGTDGIVMTQSDNRHRELVYNDRVEVPAIDGDNIYLTIDAVIQHYVEQALEAAFIEHDPLAAHALVMDVNTGEILAMGSYPSFKPNSMDLVGMPEERMEGLSSYDTNMAKFGVWKNDLVESTYELGSTIKLVTAAIALEENVATPNTVFNEGNNIQVADWNIKAWYYPQTRGEETLTEAVGNSSNPVFVKLGQMIGKDAFYDYYVDFGLDKPTGIDLPGESYPVTNTYDEINQVELATMTFGHGVAQTPIQVASALSAIVNGGFLLEPHIVKRIEDQDGLIEYQAERTVVRQVVSEITSQQMRDIMEYVVDDASGSAVKIPGYRIGGKTGTSEKPDENGGYSEDKAIASFVAVAPINNPEILVYVVVDEPKDEIFGSKVAGPITKNILIDTLDYLEIARDDSKLEDTMIVPDFIGMTLEDTMEMAEDLGFEVNVVSDASYDDSVLIINQYPKGGSERTRGSVILLEINN